MESVTPLHLWNIESFVALVPPTLRHLLTEIGAARDAAPAPAFGFGAFCEDTPAGVAIARGRPDGALELSWVYVVRSRRRRGIGSALLEVVETVGRRRQAGRLSTAYPSAPPHAAAIESLLARGGWALPDARLALRAVSTKITSARWFDRWRLDRSITIFRWADLGADDRRSVDAALLEDPWAASRLSPWQHEPGMDAKTSLGMRRGSEILGWVITHRRPPHDLDYSVLYVRPPFRGSGIAFALIAEAVRRQIAAYGLETRGFLATARDNIAMMRVIDRALAPFTVWRAEARTAHKLLAP